MRRRLSFASALTCAAAIVGATDRLPSTGAAQTSSTSHSSAPPAQQPASPPAPQAMFRSSTRLIVETVRVTDRDGNPIEGLTAKDFAVTEDGQPQDVAFVEFQRLADTGALDADDLSKDDHTERAPDQRAASAPLPGSSIAPALQPTIAIPAAGDTRYQNRRLLVLYFDLTAMRILDQGRAFANATRFVETQMGPADLVAIMAFEGTGVRVRQDFTGNRARLRAVLQSLSASDDDAGDAFAASRDASSAFGQDDAEFNIFNTDRQLSALQTAVTMLRGLAEQKALVYFGGGLRLNGTDNQAQLRATVNAAIRANVTINPIDARGLVAMAPLGDASRSVQTGVGLFSGSLVQSVLTRVQQSQDTLHALAADTGGKALFDYNDLSAGIVQAAKALTSYYMVGYYTTHTQPDGKLRRVRVTLNDRPSASLSYRRGYYADKEFGKFTAADKERQLEEALMLDNPITDISMAVEVNYFQISRAEYFVPVALKIPGRELALAGEQGASRTVIDFIGEVKDRYGVTYQNVRDKMELKLGEERVGQLKSRPIQYETGFTLLPGEYVIKMLARDATTGRIGTYQTSFVVPHLERESTRLPTSSVVLSSQRMPLGEAISSVRQKVDTDSVNPLVYDGQKLIPSVTRVFSRSRDLYVFFEAYQREAAAAQPLVALVAFYRGDVKAFETEPLVIGPAEENKEQSKEPRNEQSKAQSRAPSKGVVPIRFSIPLASLATGRYDCQVTVLSPENQKVAFWRAPIALVR